MEIDTLGQNIRSNQDVIFIIVFTLKLWVEAIFNFDFQSRATLTAVIHDTRVVDVSELFVKIFRSFSRLSKNNDFFTLHNRVGSQVMSKLFKFRISGD